LDHGAAFAQFALSSVERIPKKRKVRRSLLKSMVTLASIQRSACAAQAARSQ